MTTLRSGQKLEPPEMPSGQIKLQAPPELQPHEGAGNALMTAIPMLGSVGSIVLVAGMSQTSGGGSNPRMMIAAAGTGPGRPLSARVARRGRAAWSP